LPNKKHRAANPNNKIIFGPRWCSKCEQTKPNHNGSYEVFNNGKNQRWLCHECSTLKQ